MAAGALAERAAWQVRAARGHVPTKRAFTVDSAARVTVTSAQLRGCLNPQGDKQGNTPNTHMPHCLAEAASGQGIQHTGTVLTKNSLSQLTLPSQPCLESDAGNSDYQQSNKAGALAICPNIMLSTCQENGGSRQQRKTIGTRAKRGAEVLHPCSAGCLNAPLMIPAKIASVQLDVCDAHAEVSSFTGIVAFEELPCKSSMPGQRKD